MYNREVYQCTVCMTAVTLHVKIPNRNAIAIVIVGKRYAVLLFDTLDIEHIGVKTMLVTNKEISIASIIHKLYKCVLGGGISFKRYLYNTLYDILCNIKATAAIKVH